MKLGFKGGVGVGYVKKGGSFMNWFTFTSRTTRTTRFWDGTGGGAGEGGLGYKIEQLCFIIIWEKKINIFGITFVDC